MKSSPFTNSIALTLLFFNFFCQYNAYLSKTFAKSRFSSPLFDKISLTSDGAVWKEIVSPGQGKTIEVGDILAVEYSASLKDSNFVFAKGDQEKFVVKDGSMIRGWDIGVGSMKIGEKSKFVLGSKYAYGEKGVIPVIPPNSDVEINIKVLAWLGNQLNPESLFEKDLDIDPFIASTPESIQAEFDNKQASIANKYKGNIFEIYLRRIKSISLGFGGSNFFASQSGEKAPWYLTPNLTFPIMISITLAAFITVLANGGVKEKGERIIFDNVEISQTSE